VYIQDNSPSVVDQFLLALNGNHKSRGLIKDFCLGVPKDILAIRQEMVFGNIL